MAISVVVPCFNEEESLPGLHARLTAVCRTLGLAYEIVLVDDGSRDGTWAEISARAETDPCLRGIRLARNHGHQLALTAGLAAARGGRVMMLDADLQDPPELLPDMMALMDEGYDVVYGRRTRREGESAFKKATASLFYRLINRLSDVEIPVDVGDFRLVNRRVLDAFLAMPERTRFVRGMFAWLGHRQIGLDYVRQPREAGETKYPLAKMVRFAGDALTGFSIAPLRLATLLAYVSLAVAAGLAFYVLSAHLAGQTLQGWTSILLAIAFFSGIQLLTLGIIGEYLGRLYVESKERPLFLVAETIGGETPARANTIERARA
ncbi:MAG: glycosyltransferase family 2 protein [Pseudomonadota bacterium]